MTQRLAFDEVDDFYDRQQNFSQDFWKNLNMSVLNAASENTRILLCWHEQGHHEQNKEVATWKEVYSFIQWLAEGRGKAADPSIIHFKICQPFFTTAPPLTRGTFPCLSACLGRVASGKRPPEKRAFFCLTLVKKLQECFRRSFHEIASPCFWSILAFSNWAFFVHLHTKLLVFLDAPPRLTDVRGSVSLPDFKIPFSRIFPR